MSSTTRFGGSTEAMTDGIVRLSGNYREEAARARGIIARTASTRLDRDRH